MARLGGVDIPNNKKVWVGLTYIFGVGRSTSYKILTATGINPDKRVGEMNEQEISTISQYIDDNLMVEGDLRKERGLAIKRLIEIGSYRGWRHRLGLPCRGQITRSNARTRRGLAGKRGIKKK